MLTMLAMQTNVFYADDSFLYSREHVWPRRVDKVSGHVTDDVTCWNLREAFSCF